jgi:hypothetical protein
MVVGGGTSSARVVCRLNRVTFMDWVKYPANRRGRRSWEGEVTRAVTKDFLHSCATPSHLNNVTQSINVIGVLLRLVAVRISLTSGTGVLAMRLRGPQG